MRLGSFSEVAVEEIVIEANAPCSNKRVKDISWPRDSVIATLRRGRQALIPNGDTLLKAGDVLVVAAEGEAREAVRNLAQGVHE